MAAAASASPPPPPSSRRSTRAAAMAAPATHRCTSWERCCVTEPSAGTDTTAISTTAVLRGNSRYVVNGQKVWTSRAEHSDLMLLLARTTPRSEVKKKTDGISVFLVDMRAARGKGLTIRPIRTMINHATTEVFFDNLEVPAENLIGEEGRGFRCILDGMNAERILIGAECIGDARWFIAKATA